MRRIKLTDAKPARRYIAIRRGKDSDEYLLVCPAPRNPDVVLRDMHTLLEFARLGVETVVLVELSNTAEVVNMKDYVRDKISERS